MAQKRTFNPLRTARNFIIKQALQSADTQSRNLIMKQAMQATTPAPTWKGYAPGGNTLPVSVAQDNVNDLFVSQLQKLSIRGKQLLMMHMYADENFFVERLTNNLTDPIIGRKGIQVHADEETSPKLYKHLNNFARFNGLLDPKWQRGQLRDKLNTGERCYMRVHNKEAQCSQLIQVHAPTIRNIIVDPGNYNEAVVVEVEQGNGKVAQLRIIKDQRKLTSAGRKLQNACKYECFLFQNRKRNYPTESCMADDPLRRLELRGEPYLWNSADLLKKLVEYLWSSVDKADSWNRYNYLFKVNVGENTEQEEAEATINAWKQFIGTPRQNSAIYIPEGMIDMEPVSFPMQSQDLSALYKMFRDAAAWHAGSTQSAMGEGDVRYASTKETGVEEPSVAQKENLQGDAEAEYRQLFEYEAKLLYDSGRIPKKEVVEVSPFFSVALTITSNEISKKSQQDAADAFETIVNTATTMKQDNIATPESINNGVITKAMELLNMELDVAEETEEEQPPPTDDDIDTTKDDDE